MKKEKAKKMERERDPKDDAMRFLGYRARTKAEVRQHLEAKGHGSAEIDETLAFLSQCGFVDDGDYCCQFIEYSMERGRGPLRIRRDLEGKGVDPQTVSLKLEELLSDEEERDLAMGAAIKFLNRGSRPEGAFEGGEEDLGSKALDEKDLARVGRRLASQGFHNGVIYYVLGKLRP